MGCTWAGLTAQELDAVERAAAGLQRNWRIAKQGPQATWYGLVEGSVDLAYPYSDWPGHRALRP